MSKKLSKKEIEKRQKHMERYLASMKLEGMSLSEQQRAMFDMFDNKGWDSQQCIDFIEKMYGYKKE